MKHNKWLSALLIGAMLLCLVGCAKKEETVPTTEAIAAATEAPALSAQELYSAARAAVDSAEALTLRVDKEKSTTVGGEIFLETSVQNLELSGRGTANMKSLLAESVSYGAGYETVFQEVYSEGKLYVLVDGSYRLCADVDAQAQAETLTPAVLLDAALYGSITSSLSGSGTSISFTQPTAGETWALPEGARLLNASGSALVGNDGSLKESTYMLTYDYGSTQVTEKIRVTVTPGCREILEPTDAFKYMEIQDIGAVRLSELACGALKQAKSVSSTSTETIVSMATGMQRTQTTAVDLYDGSELIAKVSTNVALSSFLSGQTETYTQEEKYQDKIYTVSTNGGAPAQKEGMDDAAVNEYCDSSFLSGFISLDFWKDATVQEVGDLYLVECAFNTNMSEEVRSYISQLIYSDPTALSLMAPNSNTVELTGYFSLDKYTGLPVAAGYRYAGSDNLEGQEYMMTLEVNQNFHAPNLSVYETLTGKKANDLEPSEKATPLLYHVTGANGQEMYLMGTIHVGDARTAYLPQQVTDAFNASQALAVEFDTIAFQERIATDPALQAMIAANYYYMDGTTVLDHVPADVVEKAQLAMKATGNYNSSLAMLKPSLWANTLENFYLRQGYKLTADKGMDSRLLLAAKAQGKEILNVESGEAQLMLLSNFSDGIQGLLLDQAVSYGPCEYWQEAEALYELWCQGDEAALRTALSESMDTFGMTDEEKALFMEYSMMMIGARNGAMLETAKGYLESGKKVFFAVGLAHLLQDNGLVDTLAQAGYTVEQVIYS